MIKRDKGLRKVKGRDILSFQWAVVLLSRWEGCEDEQDCACGGVERKAERF
jgi:hypothetical protein